MVVITAVAVCFLRIPRTLVLFRRDISYRPTPTDRKCELLHVCIASLSRRFRLSNEILGLIRRMSCPLPAFGAKPERNIAAALCLSSFPRLPTRLRQPSFPRIFRVRRSKYL